MPIGNSVPQKKSCIIGEKRIKKTKRIPRCKLMNEMCRAVYETVYKKQSEPLNILMMS